jgi:hypothetical protein
VSRISSTAVGRFENSVIPGASETSEPGIHNHDREYGFSDVQLHIKACAEWRIHDVRLHIGE